MRYGLVCQKEVDAQALQEEWRSLYPIAWADFERFMSGWNPAHRKLTDYSDATTERAIDDMTNELMTAARNACLTAGRFIQDNRDRPLEVKSKGFESKASDVVTGVDLKAQVVSSRVTNLLSNATFRFTGGRRTGRRPFTQERLLDPSTPWMAPNILLKVNLAMPSIALVSQSGQPILGVVYDPINDALYEAVTGGERDT